MSKKGNDRSEIFNFLNIQLGNYALNVQFVCTNVFDNDFIDLQFVISVQIRVYLSSLRLM